MKFLVDNQLPPALARLLNEAGSEATHVLDAGLARAKDSEIWAFAIQRSLTLVTKDEDFLQFSLRDKPRGCLIWVLRVTAAQRFCSSGSGEFGRPRWRCWRRVSG